jgi:hypothetical protein
MIKIILLYLRRLHLMRAILRVLAVIITISMFVTFAGCSTEPSSKEYKQDSSQSIPQEDDFVRDYKPEEKNFIGNTAANMLQRAYVAKQGDWIYYFNGLKGIVKRNDVTGETKEVTTTAGHQISVLGDYIYFIKDIGNDNLGELWKIRTDGKDLSMVAEGFFCKSGEYLYNAFYGVADDKIYFAQDIRQPNGDTKRFLCKMNLDGSESEPIIEVVSFLGATETHLFFRDHDDQNNRDLVKALRIDGRSNDFISFLCAYSVLGEAIKKPFSDDTYPYCNMYKDFSITGDTLYFYRNATFVQAQADNSDQFTSIADIYLGYPTMNVYNGTLFTWKGGLVKIKLQTREVTQINKSNAYNINIVDDKWIYYR